MKDVELDLPKQCIKISPHKDLLYLLQSRPVAWIGSGLSRVAASLGAICSRKAERVACAMTPFEFCQLSGDTYLPVIISYSGGNLDSIAVAEHVAEHHLRAVLVTSCPESRSANIIREAGLDLSIVQFPEHPPEKRFVALDPFLGACALAYRLASGEASNALAGLESRMEPSPLMSIENWTRRRWVILASGMTRMAALAWQVLLAESALADVLVVDMKDYTHARYLAALNRSDPAFLILSDPQSENLAKTLQLRLSEYGPAPLIHVCGHPHYVLWAHLKQAYASIGPLCQKEGWDLENPPKPNNMQYWSNWGHIRRVGKEKV